MTTSEQESSQVDTTIPKLSKENPTATEFDNYYRKEDPWGIKDSVVEIVRQKN